MSLAGELRLGFVALTDAAPLLVADELGLFEDEGLTVSLVREASWATVRDKVAGGVLDGAHLLAAIPLAARRGAGGMRADLIAPLALNANAAAITLSTALLDELGGEPRLHRRLGKARFGAVGEHDDGARVGLAGLAQALQGVAVGTLAGDDDDVRCEGLGLGL